MSLLDEARKPQERKDADVVIGHQNDEPGAGFEAVCTGIHRKPSQWTEGVDNVYVAGTMDDGRTLLVLGQTKVLREEIEASGLAVGSRFAVFYQGLGQQKPGRKPPRIYRFVTESTGDTSTESVPF